MEIAIANVPDPPASGSGSVLGILVSGIAAEPPHRDVDLRPTCPHLPRTEIRPGPGHVGHEPPKEVKQFLAGVRHKLHAAASADSLIQTSVPIRVPSRFEGKPNHRVLGLGTTALPGYVGVLMPMSRTR